MKAPHISPQFIRFSGRATYPSFCCISPCQNAARQLSPYPTRQRLDCEIPSMAALVTSSPCSNRLPVCRPSWHSCKNSSRAACHPDQRCPARIILSRLLARAVNNHISYLHSTPCHVIRSTGHTTLTPREENACGFASSTDHKFSVSRSYYPSPQMEVLQRCRNPGENGG